MQDKLGQMYTGTEVGAADCRNRFNYWLKRLKQFVVTRGLRYDFDVSIGAWTDLVRITQPTADRYGGSVETKISKASLDDGRTSSEGMQCRLPSFCYFSLSAVFFTAHHLFGNEADEFLVSCRPEEKEVARNEFCNSLAADLGAIALAVLDYLVQD